MPQPDWQGFPIRLGRAIDRWPGGGQRAFVEALAAHAQRADLRIPTSYRTLVNYLNRMTRPSEAWVEAAADVLGQPSGYLLTGVHDVVLGESGAVASGLMFGVAEGTEARTEALILLILGDYLDLPEIARMIVFGVACYYFAHDREGWENWRDHRSEQAREIIRQNLGEDHPAAVAPSGPDRRTEVAAMVREYFGPLFAIPPRQPEHETLALAASLAATAYLRLGTHPRRRD